MDAQKKIEAITSLVGASNRQLHSAYRNYPREVLDLIVFHKFHFYMSELQALDAFRRLKATFVDWNEVRISSVKEIQEIFAESPDSLELAIFIKDFLEHLQRRRRSLNLEFLVDLSMGDIRRFLREIKGVEASTINLVLRQRKEHPVLPMSGPMEQTLLRLGLVRRTDNRDQKEKYLHNLVEADFALPFHHFLLQHSREVCPPEEEKIQCMSCKIRSSCTFFQRNREKLAAKKSSKSGN